MRPSYIQRDLVKLLFTGFVFLSLGSSLLACTAILDFSDPIESEEIDAAESLSDASISFDSDIVPDAMLPAICSDGEPNDDLMTAVEFTGVHEAAICGVKTDIDVYSFTLPETTLFHFQLFYESANDGEVLYMQLLSSNGMLLKDSTVEDSGKTLLPINIDLPTEFLPGNYYLQVRASPDSTASFIRYSILAVP